MGWLIGGLGLTVVGMLTSGILGIGLALAGGIWLAVAFNKD